MTLAEIKIADSVQQERILNSKMNYSIGQSES